MTVKSFKEQFQEALTKTYPQTEIDTFFFWVIEHYLNLSRTDFLIQPTREIDLQTQQLLGDVVERLQKEEPIQYILGETEFYGLPFKVSSDVLIPRPETEELVSWIIQEAQNTKYNVQSISILDIGTGSGCIPITLKKEIPSTDVHAIDVSDKALSIAKENANLNKTSVKFLRQDILSTSTLHQQFDIIVSNPPYVRELEKHEIKNNVLENEPHLALFVPDNDALVFYSKIAELAAKSLKSDGFLFFEINQYLGKETVDLVKNKGFKNVELKKDLFGNDRMIKASL